MSNPWWICEKCGELHETRPGKRPTKLKCRCGGDIIPDFGLEAEFDAELERVEEFNAKVGPCPDLQAMGLGWDKPIIH